MRLQQEPDKQNSPKVYDWIFQLFLQHALKEGNERFTSTNWSASCPSVKVCRVVKIFSLLLLRPDMSTAAFLVFVVSHIIK